MARHKEKDDEAGGEGLGVLATRKRLWRDADGNIVNTRRPNRQEHARRRQLAAKTTKVKDAKQQNDEAAPPSPPTSNTSSSSSRNAEPASENNVPQDSWPPMEIDPLLTNDDSGDSLDFLCNASWGSQTFPTFMGASEDLPYDDIFKPDTGESDTFRDR
jgi:hypothetical protein